MVGYKRSREGGQRVRAQGARRAGLEPQSLVGQLDAGEGRRMRSGAGRLMNLLSIASPPRAKKLRGQPLLALAQQERINVGAETNLIPQMTSAFS